MSIVNTFDTFIVDSDYRDGFQLQNALFNWLKKKWYSSFFNYDCIVGEFGDEG